jgi:hypothetical protein
MSGAASIAAAKNRRSKETPRFVQSCPAKSGTACPRNAPPQQSAKTTNNAGNDNNNTNKMVDPVTLRVLGPMQPLQIIQIHEQRLNNFDKKIEELKALTPVLNEVTSFSPQSQPQMFSMEQFNNACNTGSGACNTGSGACNTACSEECSNKFADLEEKITILEEVVMNLQLTLANVQNFAMETNLCMMKLNKAAASSVPVETIAVENVRPENIEQEHISIKINELVDTTVLTEVFSPPLD